MSLNLGYLAAHQIPLFFLVNNIRSNLRSAKQLSFLQQLRRCEQDYYILPNIVHRKKTYFHRHRHSKSSDTSNIKMENSPIVKPSQTMDVEDLLIIKKALIFDNITLRELSVDSTDDNYIRTVKALQSRVQPTPLSNPRLVCWSKSAAQSINIDEYKLEGNTTFIKALAGQTILPGSVPVAHNYCGHQFGQFAGQLGDGAAINLGEIIVQSKAQDDLKQGLPSDDQGIAKRCFLQLKGSGLTPYSRTADGRKVLRSSIREFLCSEAMHHLGIPTTRALCIIKSDETVQRDMFYDGNVKHENCAIVCRLAETFFRFGTFELFKLMDPQTNRSGPCVGMNDFKQKLLDFTIEQYFQNASKKEGHTNIDQKLLHDNLGDNKLHNYTKFFIEVIEETAKLVALWESVGFCHGVLNTDNMSIKGLTIDYGPFGFMERFNRNLVPNTSDDGGRYRFQKQPEMVQWNLQKLAQALDPLLPVSLGKRLIAENFMSIYNRTLKEILCRKLGLFYNHGDGTNWNQSTSDQMDEIVTSFFKTIEETQSDFTNSFRYLSSLILPGMPGHEESKIALVEALVKEAAGLRTLMAETKEEMSKPQIQFTLRVLDKDNPNDLMLLGMLGIDPDLAIEVRTRYDSLKEMTEEKKRQENVSSWTGWVNEYCSYLRKHSSSDNIDILNQNQIERNRIMNGVNPKFILRNHVMQKAIDAAERDDFNLVKLLLFLSENPFSDIDLMTVRKIVADISELEFASLYKPSDLEKRIKVSCSS